MAKWSFKKRIEVYNKFNGHCAYCGIKLNKNHFHIDHIIPKYRGYSDMELTRMNIVRGENDILNYNPCCMSCNSSKSVYSIEKWRDEINQKFNRLLKYESSFNLLHRMKIISNKPKVWRFYFEKYN